MNEEKTNQVHKHSVSHGDVDEVDGSNMPTSAVDIDFLTNEQPAVVSDPECKIQGESVNGIGSAMEEWQISQASLVKTNDELRQTLHTINSQYVQLQAILSQKDSVIELQQKELQLLEGEKTSLKRDFESAKKEKEQAVVRYAMVEKTIIDSNAAKDLSAKKLKDAQRELESLNQRLKFVIGERDKAQKEFRDSIRECEALKNDLQSFEMKVKWNQVKLKQEMNTKAALEGRVGELTQQLNQLNDARQNQIDTEKKAEQEQGAQVIMLKHIAEEKEKELVTLQGKFGQLKTELTELTEKHKVLVAVSDRGIIENGQLSEKLLQLGAIVEEQRVQLEENAAKLDELENSTAVRGKQLEEIELLATRLKAVEEEFLEQSLEAVRLRAKEDELMKLIKELTEKCVVVDNKLTLANCKSSALQLENEKIKGTFEEQQKSVADLEERLLTTKMKRTAELKLFGKLLSDQKNLCDSFKQKLDNVCGDLDATKKKKAQIIKELNRELTAMRTKSEQTSKNSRMTNGAYSETNGKSTENGRDHEIEQEPSKKALIDRIVKLQRMLAKQTEKIEFLENHCAALVNELRAKSS